MGASCCGTWCIIIHRSSWAQCPTCHVYPRGIQVCMDVYGGPVLSVPPGSQPTPRPNPLPHTILWVFSIYWMHFLFVILVHFPCFISRVILLNLESHPDAYLPLCNESCHTEFYFEIHFCLADYLLVVQLCCYHGGVCNITGGMMSGPFCEWLLTVPS